MEKGATTNVDVELIFERMAEHRSGKVDPKDTALVQSAYLFAQKAHEGQKRNSGEPYFTHVFSAGLNAAEFGMDAVTIAAALLHDTIEDTPVTHEEVEEKFGSEIANLVEGVTKLGRYKYQGRERHVESLRKLFIASTKDVRVIIIKLADRLHNIQTLEHVKPEKQKRIALETIEVHANMAWRLGMGKLTGELQDLAFPYAYPKEYEMTEKLLRQKKKTDEKYLEKVYKSLKKELALHGLSENTTQSRIKRKYSLYKKLQRKDMDIEKIYDIVALRVLVPTIEDCYKVLGIVHNMWRPFPGRIKDYIAVPKMNGYQSIHTTIFTGDGGITEIQIRTPKMHHEAEYGIAAHFAYKTDSNTDTPELTWMKQLSAISKEGPKDFVKDLKTDFFNDRIFVFTPEGDVVDLPAGSSVIDFAFAIHSDIGMHATGAKVNGKFSALKTRLRTDDIIEIETRENAHPTSKWLDYAVTALARRHIQRYMRENSSSIFGRFFGKSDK
jgi:GTP pyrophosphokinase